MKLVVVESPYAGVDRASVEKNISYARAAMAHCLHRGESPYASHLLYPQILDDNKPHERTLGIEAGFAWGAKADLRAFYVDLGWSRGMKAALTKYRLEGLRYEFRVLGRPWSWLAGALGPDGESEWMPSERRVMELLAADKRGSELLTTLGVLRSTLEALESRNMIERDTWPDGSEYWSLKESST